MPPASRQLDWRIVADTSAGVVCVMIAAWATWLMAERYFQL